MDKDETQTTPLGRLSKGARKKLSHPGREPGDPRAGRVTLTTPLRDIETLDLVTAYLESIGAVRVNRSTVIRALCRYARQQLDSNASQVANVAGRNLFDALKNQLEVIDGESFR